MRLALPFLLALVAFPVAAQQTLTNETPLGDPVPDEQPDQRVTTPSEEARTEPVCAPERSNYQTRILARSSFGRGLTPMRSDRIVTGRIGSDFSDDEEDCPEEDEDD